MEAEFEYGLETVIRPIRRIAIAVQARDGDDYVYRAIDASDVDITWSGFVQSAALDSAVLELLLLIRSEIDPEDRIRFLINLPPKSPLWKHQEEVRAALPRCTVQGPSLDDGDLMESVHAALDSDIAVLDSSEPDELSKPPLTVAADGSVRGSFCGYAWLASDGTYGLHGRIDSRKIIGSKPSLVTELRAIDDAVRRLSRRHLTIYCDNSFAVSMARKWMGGECILPEGYTTERDNNAVAGLITAQRRLHRNSFRLDIRWERSHQGEPLNEGADALARLASRYAKGDSGLSPNEYRQRAKGLAKAFAADFRRVVDAKNSPEN